MLYSQVKLSSSYANLINCQGKQSFVVTEVQQFDFASHFSDNAQTSQGPVQYRHKATLASKVFAS